MASITRFALSLAAVGALASPPVLQAAPVEYFHQPTFAAAAGTLTTVGFDAIAQGNGVLSGSEFAGLGLTIIGPGGAAFNVVGNTGTPHGPNFVTVGNLASTPNAISFSIQTGGASPVPPDNFDFVLSTPTSAAGLFIGNLGNQGSLTTTVSFLDASAAVIASELLDQAHAGLIPGAFFATLPFDNRIFYGITSDTPIARIRVQNGPNDGDGIAIDDVQFAVSAVPEPGSFALLALGLLALALRSRRVSA